MLSHAGPAGPLVFLPDGRSLITGGADGSIRRWDPADGHLEALRLHAHAGTVSAIAASADGQRLASIGADGDLKNWDVAAHLSPVPFAGVEAKVRSLALSPDGKVLASASADGVVQLWDTAGGRQRAEPIGSESRQVRLAFSPDGKVLATLPLGVELRAAEALGPLERARAGHCWRPSPMPRRGRSPSRPTARALATGGRPDHDLGPGRRAAVPHLQGDRRAWSVRSRSLPTARRSPRRAATAPSRSGTRPTAS